jgi:hypothetical protein
VGEQRPLPHGRTAEPKREGRTRYGFPFFDADTGRLLPYWPNRAAAAVLTHCALRPRCAPETICSSAA